jgi:hypothetical protein
MGYCRNLMVFAVFFALISAFMYIAQAEIRQITVEPMKSTAFGFEVKNNNSQPTVYTMYFKGLYLWLVLVDSQIVLSPGESRKVSVVAFPDYRISGQFPIEIVAESRFDKITSNFVLNVPELQAPPQLENSVNSVSFDERGFQIYLYCQEPLNLTVSIFRDGVFVDGVSGQVGPGSQKITRALSFRPGNYSAKYELRRNNETLFSGEKAYVKAYVPQIVMQELVNDSFFKSVTTIKLTNNGTMPDKAVYEIGAEKYLEPFLSSSEPFEAINNGGSIVNHWEFMLEAGESKTFNYTYSYTYGFIAVFVVLAGIIALYFLMNRGMHIKKSVAAGPGGIKSSSEVKVYLEVSNRTGRRIKDIMIEDYVQPLFKIRKNFTGIAPSGFYRKGDDIRIAWKIPKIEPNESRVFTYTLVPKVGLGSGYSFSKAKLTYRIGSYRRIVMSNSARSEK